MRRLQVRSSGYVLIAFILTSRSAFCDVVAHWRFQDGIGGKPAESARLIRDSSGNDRHGHVLGRPKYRSVDMPGSNLGLAFDGVDDRIHIPDHELFYLSDSLTIEAYIEIENYPGSNAGFSHIVFRGDDQIGFDPWYLGITESGQLKFLIANAYSDASVVLSPEPLPTGELLHVAGTLDAKTGQQTLYINGKEVGSAVTKIRAGGLLGGARPGIGLGNRQTHSNQGFRGTIDEVRISSEALRPQEFIPTVASVRLAGNAKKTKRVKTQLRANYVVVVADDFVVDVFHNGVYVPDSKRRPMLDRFGASVERIDISVSEGDWLVFNVVNNRLRWGGAYYFAAAGCFGKDEFGFVSQLKTAGWSACDSPSDVQRFIGERDYLRHQSAQAVARPWHEGTKLMRKYAGAGWDGEPVWGTRRNTWLKVVVSSQQKEVPQAAKKKRRTD